MGVAFIYIYVPHMCLLPLEAIMSSGTGIRDGCELPYWSWGLNLGPLKKQLVLIASESSLQPVLTGLW